MSEFSDSNRAMQPASLPVALNCEWVGGVISSPYVIDEPEPWKPKMILWREIPSGLVVGHELCARGEEQNALGRVLIQTMQSPMAGEPRRPVRIRVCDDELANEVRAVAGDFASVTVAPTPEIDEVVDAMIEALAGKVEEESSYLEGGRISPELIADLFSAAKTLYAVAPWRRVDDDQVLRLDIPKLGVEAACVSIIGALDEHRGIIIFPSFEGYEAFIDAVDERPRARGQELKFGTSWTSLTFERAADLSGRMRREILQHGWETAGTDACPHVMHAECDGAVGCLTERNVRIVAACARWLAAFFIKHERPFERAEIEPICESWMDDDNLAVRFTVPYEAHDLFDVGEPERGHEAAHVPAHVPKVARNSPCPCGSGKKYKKCCLPREETQSRHDADLTANHEMDGRLVRDLMSFARDRFGREWLEWFRHFDLDDEEMVVGLLAPWSVFHRVVQGRALPDWYLHERGTHLSATQREWLNAQRAAWLSIWEVREVRPGEGLTLHDLLSGETRAVREISGSRLLVKRDTVLARVVDWHSISLICGMHTRGLPPSEAAEVVRRARAKLRLQKSVPLPRLRDEAFGRFLICRWEEALHELEVRRSAPPKLCNTDGDPLLLTTDHFDVVPAARAELCSRLAVMDGVQPPDDDEEDSSYRFVRAGKAKHGPLEEVLIGRAWLSDDSLHVETNSIERADGLRAALEKACGGLISHRSREHVDPTKLALEEPPDLPPAETQQLLLAFKERHYASWADSSLPALAGHTPREAVRSARGRAEVDVLLRDMENHEQRLPAGERFDFSRLRRELGLR